MLRNVLSLLALLSVTSVIICPVAAQVSCPDATALSPNQVQGDGFFSSKRGNTVAVTGIVSQIRDDDRLYIQSVAKADDGNPVTSEGLLLYSPVVDWQTFPGLAVGKLVVATGEVQEFRSNTGYLTTTELFVSAASDVAVCPKCPKQTACVSKPVLIKCGGSFDVGRSIPVPTIYDGNLNLNTCGDSCPVLQPGSNALSFYESLEGNLITIENALVTGINSFGDFYIVPCNGGIDKEDRNARCGITNDPAENDFSPEVIKVSGSTLPAGFTQPQIGDHIETITGSLDFEFGEFALYPRDISAVDTDLGFCAPKVEGPTALRATPGELPVATYNIENFPGDGGAEADVRLAEIADHIANTLQSPAIVALQEQQDNNGNTNDAVVAGDEVGVRIVDAIVAAGGPRYTWTDIPPVDDQDGGIPGGNIRVAFLYNPDVVELADSLEGRKGTSTEAVGVVEDASDGTPQLTVNPGRVMPTDPAFDNSRKPLAAHFVDKVSGEDYYIVNVHFASKGGSDPLFGAIQPPENGGEDDRIAQAKIVAEFIRRILCIDPNANAVVLGDMNEFRAFPPLQTLASEGYVEDLLLKLPKEERYTYIFQGRSQALDHIMVSPALFDASQVDVLHVNTGLQGQASDHDPTLAILSPGSGTAPSDLDCDFPPPPPPPAPCPVVGTSNVYINELHYDNAGTDDGEFVEIAGPVDLDVSGYQIFGYNGNGGGTYKDVTFPEDATLTGGAETGYASIAFSGLQNGAPDGIALVYGNCVLEFISYEGSFDATNGPAVGLTSVDIGVAEDSDTTPAGASLGKLADDTWAVCQSATPGAANTNCGGGGDGGGGGGGGGGGTPPLCPEAGSIYINELHYDNDGADANEFVEIAGPAGTDVSGHQIIGYNGNGGAPYNPTGSSGPLQFSTGSVLDGTGTGYAALSFPGLQNGFPDGVALVSGDCVLEFISYEGSFRAVGGPADGMLSTDIGVDEGSSTPLTASLGKRPPDGAWVTCNATPGSANDCPA